jgi:hypothetical protein
VRKLLIAIGMVTMSFGSVVGATFAYAQTSPTNCETVEGPGYFAQACGTNAQVSGGPGGSSASTGPEQLTTVIPSPTASPLPTPAGTFTPVPSVVQPTPTASPPAQRPAPVGLIGMLLRLLGLG